MTGAAPPPDVHPLDNAVWWALGDRQRHLARTHGRARAYREEVSVFAAVDSFDDGSWADLAALVGPGGTGALSRSSVPDPLPAGWTEELRGRGRQMVLGREPMVDDDVAIRRLEEHDVPGMLELVAATRPGPFGPRTVETGRYWGHVEDGRLLAMAGERLALDGWTEISAVCTAPEARGRGLASALTGHVAAAILERGGTPFLHVAVSNEPARRLYDHLGFTERRLIEFVVLSPPGSG